MVMSADAVTGISTSALLSCVSSNFSGLVLPTRNAGHGWQSLHHSADDLTNSCFYWEVLGEPIMNCIVVIKSRPHNYPVSHWVNVCVTRGFHSCPDETMIKSLSIWNFCLSPFFKLHMSRKKKFVCESECLIFLILFWIWSCMVAKMLSSNYL